MSAGAAFFGLIYESPRLVVLALTFRGAIVPPPSPEATVGLAGLALAGFGSLVGIAVGHLRRPDGDVGVSLLFWMDFFVLVLGDAVFYTLNPAAALVMLLGVVPAALTGAALVVAPRGSPKHAHADGL